MLQIGGLRHAYGDRTVLSMPSLALAAGESALLLGPSGSGKSTLLAIVAGLLSPTEGRVVVAGEDVTAMRPAARDAFRARRMGIVPQTLHLIGVLSARDNVRLARELAGHREDDGSVDAALAALGVEGVARQMAMDLSVGEAQRVAIARAVVNRPALLLADEPTSALDDVNCERVATLLREQAAACNAALLIATHDGRLREHFARVVAL